MFSNYLDDCRLKKTSMFGCRARWRKRKRDGPCFDQRIWSRTERNRAISEVTYDNIKQKRLWSKRHKRWTNMDGFCMLFGGIEWESSTMICCVMTK